MKNILYATIFLFVLAGAVFGGSISGTVYDATNSTILPGAEVVLDTPCSVVNWVANPGDSTTIYAVDVTYLNASPATNEIDVNIVYPDPIAGLVDTNYTVANGSSFEITTNYVGYFNFTLDNYDNTTNVSDTTLTYCHKVISAADGTFNISGILDGHYLLNVSATNYQSIQSGLPGGIEIDNANPLKTDRVLPPGYVSLYWTGGGTPGPVNGSISGNIQNSTGSVAGASVTAYLGGAPQGSDITDAAGDFNITPITFSGTYELRITAAAHQPRTVPGIVVDLTDPLLTHIDAGVIILTEIANADLFGFVFDQNGTAVNNAHITVSGVGTENTNAAGYYIFASSVPVGLVDVEATADNCTTQTRNNVPIPAGGRELNFTLQCNITALENGSVEGYVLDELGAPLAGATVTYAGGAANTTNASGYYILHGVPEGNRVFEASLAGYNNESNNITIIAGATVELNFTLTQGNGTIEGYVFGEGAPLNGATVTYTAGGISNTTNASGYYILHGIPAGDRELRATAGGHDPDTDNTIVIENATVELNFTLNEDDDGGGGNGGSSGGTSPQSSPGSTPPDTTYSASSDTFEDSLSVEREVIREEDQTRVILVITNNGNEAVGGFELREHLPSSVDNTDVGDYTITPDDVESNPTVISWKFNGGLATGESITMGYWIDFRIDRGDIGDFEANIYLLDQEGQEYGPQVVKVIVPEKAFVGDTVTIVALNNKTDTIIPGISIEVTTPYHNLLILVTDENGEANITFGNEGRYIYKVKNSVLAEYFYTDSIEKPIIFGGTQVTDSDAIIDTQDEGQDVILNFLDSMSGFVGYLPIIILLIVSVLAVTAVLVYLGFLSVPDEGQKDEKDKALDFIEGSMVFEATSPAKSRKGKAKKSKSKAGKKGRKR